MNFEDLQKNWQSAPVNQVSLPDLEEIKKQGNRIERKWNLELLFMIIILPLTGAFLLWVWYENPLTTAFGSTGATLMLAALAINTVIGFKMRLDSRKQKDSDLKSFAERQLKLIDQQIWFATKGMNVYAIMLITGLALVYIEMLMPFGYLIMISVTASLALIMALFFIVTIKRRLKKIRLEREKWEILAGE